MNHLFYWIINQYYYYHLKNVLNLLISLFTPFLHVTFLTDHLCSNSKKKTHYEALIQVYFDIILLSLPPNWGRIFNSWAAIWTIWVSIAHLWIEGDSILFQDLSVWIMNVLEWSFIDLTNAALKVPPFFYLVPTSIDCRSI